MVQGTTFVSGSIGVNCRARLAEVNTPIVIPQFAIRFPFSLETNAHAFTVLLGDGFMVLVKIVEYRYSDNSA